MNAKESRQARKFAESLRDMDARLIENAGMAAQMRVRWWQWRRKAWLAGRVETLREMAQIVGTAANNWDAPEYRHVCTLE